MADSFVNLLDAKRTRVDAHGFDSYVFFGQRDFDGPGPQIYVNELDPGIELAAHFHRVDQFQVFFGGNGATFLRTKISPVMVHYTDAHSTYGPFRAASDHSLAYATIRAQSSNFGGVMPAARSLLPYRGRRNLSIEVGEWELESLPNAGEHEIANLLEGADDGLAVHLLRLGAGAQLEYPAPLGTSGRSYCVLAGELLHAGRPFEQQSIGWSDPDASALRVNAGPQGCSVLALSFPFPPTQVAHLHNTAPATGN
jgi:hypothetical protein